MPQKGTCMGETETTKLSFKTRDVCGGGGGGSFVPFIIKGRKSKWGPLFFITIVLKRVISTLSL